MIQLDLRIFFQMGWFNHQLWLHPRKLTWIPKTMGWKRYLPLNMAIVGVGIYVTFLGCTLPKTNTALLKLVLSNRNLRNFHWGLFSGAKMLLVSGVGIYIYM